MKSNFMQFLEINQFFLKKEIKIRYAESLLGPLWIVLYPLVLTLISTVVFSFAFKGRVGDAPYFLFIMLGFISWIFFSQGVGQATRALVSNRELVVNANFPKLALVTSIILSRFVDYLVSLVVFLILTWVFRIPFNFLQIFWLMLVVSLQIIFQSGLSLITSALNVYYRDVQNLVDILLQLVFYATPIIYPLSLVPGSWRQYISYNPLALLVQMYRDIIFNNSVSFSTLAGVSIISFSTLAVGLLVFRKLKPRFAELI